MLRTLRRLLDVFCRKPKKRMKPDKIVAGLGNPGKQYRDTRHNVGYMVLAELVKRTTSDRPRGQFHADVWDARIGEKNVLLLCPTTFMNLSGTAVAEATRFYKLDPETDLLVVCDDLDLPVARLRVRESGSGGGQKGLKDVAEKLGTRKFARIRIGIGRPASKEQVVGYVLAPFEKSAKSEIDLAVQSAADAAELWITQGSQAVMNKYNVAEKTLKKKSQRDAETDSLAQ